ncbi:mucin-binding protein [Gemella sp.]
MKYLNNRDKQTRFSIRKYSVGVFSVSVATLYFLAGGNALAADNNAPRVSETSSGTTGTPEANPKDAEKTTEDKNAQTSANTESENNKETFNTAQPTGNATSTRAPRKRRAVGDAPTGETGNTDESGDSNAGSSTEKDEALNAAKRKGETVKTDQPGVIVPKEGEDGADDPNANLKFDDLKDDATVEEMWKIIQNMPDDFQNNERSYLRNMDTLGDALRFDDKGEVTTDSTGKALQPGEIRELHDFGGWHAIDKDGTKGKFVIGKKNEKGYFTGWYTDKDGKRQEGGMLGADALDNVYVHEQALDRRFNYMLMLAKGRTRANRNETVADSSIYNPKAPNERANKTSPEFNKLPFLERDEYNKYSPGVVGYNGIEKNFTAFSTKYGSRVRVEFVTGYISDINGSKGTYRVVIKTKNSKNEEKTVYDQTIHRIAEIVQNEKLYEQGLDVERANTVIKNFFDTELKYRSTQIFNTKKNSTPLKGKKTKDYTEADKQLEAELRAQALEEAKQQGDIVMNVDKDFLSISKSGKRDSEWKKTFTSTSLSTTRLANDLNSVLKTAITPNPDDPAIPTWDNSSTAAGKADDKTYKLLTALIPGAKKITYHVNDDQLEVETEKYSYLAARNGSKEAGIQGSDIAATESADTYNFNRDTFDTVNTNTKVNNRHNGWAKATDEDFENFSKFIGVDRGIERTNVLTDEALTNKIIEKIEGDKSKLGKGGYFSTGDIPLGKDIVSYTVQVFSENNERVGVNTQSHRVQYNLPILADFSVIQDTVEPSKEVARRIIKKQREDGKITEEQEKKITDEIDKKKKTSEVRKAISGNVKVRYVNENGEDIALSEEVAKKVGEKAEDGTYLVEKEKLIGTDYNLTDKKLGGISSGDKKYRLKRSLNNGLYNDSAPITGEVSSTDTVVKFVYEEGEATKAKAVVHVKKQQAGGTTVELDEHKLNLETEVGEEFPSESIENKVKELQELGYEIVSNTFTGGTAESRKGDDKEDVDGQEPTQSYTITVKEKTVEVTEPKNPNDPVDPEKPDGFKFEKAIEETNLKKDVTRTIKYMIKATPTSEEIESGKAPVIQTVHFKRKAIYNLVTKTVTYENWTTDSQSFPEVMTPELEGYTPDKASVEATQAETPAQDGTVKNITEKVIYTPKEQKLLVKVFNTTTGQEVELPDEKIELTGKTNELVDTTSVKEKIKKFKERGYVVQENPIPDGLKYDAKDDLANEEPTQVYKLFVREPISVDTDSKTVTRTIKYVKKDYNNGVEVLTEVSKTVTNTATFNREIKFNLVTGKTTYGTWSENKTFEKVTSPVVTGYIADKAEVAKNEVTANTEDINEEVIYTKIGNWIPNKPGETPTPIPYPNHPTDPTKPGEPTQVIPHVPGYTPKVGDKPLVPKNPKDLTEGYTPPTPTTPTENTEITYVADPQKAVVKVYNVKDSEETELTNDKLTMNGKTDEVIPTQSLKDKIEELKKRGYIIDEEPLQNGEKFDNEKDLDSQDPTQVFKLKVHEKLIPVTPPTADKPLKPGTPIDPDAPVVPNTPNDPLIPTWTEELINKVKNAETTKEVTRTINYVDESGVKLTYTDNGKETKEPKTDKVTFTREAKINLVTKEITYGEWKAKDNDRTFDAVSSPVVKGYILKANQDTQNGLVSTDGTSVVASENLTATSENQNLNVVYTKLGSWIPKVPGEETPTPLPYPNDPNDPTKPGKPTDPNTPVIPYLPGYTPKIGDKPLEPKVPGDPTKGYIPPDVPKEPGTDTEITYEGNPQKILIKVVNVTTGVEVPLDNEKLEFNGKSGETVKETDKNSVDAKITSLRNRGYIVDTVNPLTATTKYDTESDAGKQEPTQTYKLVVREKISADKESTTVTRTIKYVKVDVQDGKEVRTELNTEKIKTKVDKVEFSRNTTTSLTTGLTEIGAWNHAKQDFSKVDTPVLEGYLANKVSVPSKEVTPESVSIEEVVEYRKIGSWIPNVPGGKTPTPIPYPNDPDDPTKPKNPEYPETPGGNETPGTPTDPNKPTPPVIPYVPGYTPMVPTDPTKPVNPNTNPLKPLVPVDPEHPEKGYKVPPVPEIPNDPKKDTPIEYEADTQKAVTKFVDSSGNPVPGINNIEETGKSGELLTKATEVTTEIAKLIAKGYDLVSNNYGQDNNGNFDKDSGKDQEYTVVLKPHVEPIKPFDPTNPKDPNKPVPGQPIDPDTPVDPNNPNDPTIPRWTEDLINKLETTKHVTRTISYVNEKGNKVEYIDKDGNQSTADVIDKVTFIREAKINVVTGVIEYGKWTPVNNDTTFDKVTSPVVKGYILKDVSQKEVAATENITENSKDETIKVVYVPVGKWTPKVPEGETPVNPIPYPNDPTDPGKVVDPNEPTNPNDPNKPSVPAIPHIPGTTPKVPKVPNKPVDPDTNPLVPLTPVDPEDPTKGYVLPTPTIPTENTEVEYVKDKQKATVTYVVEGTNAVLHTDNLEGASGTPINYTTTAKLTELKLRGYELVTDGFTTATDKNFDKDTKVDQSFVVTVKPKVIDIIPVDPTNPNDPNKPVPGQPIDPDTPVDPNNPNDPTIPRWTDELIKKLDVKKEVTRTINYVDEEGNKLSESSTDKVTFTREAKINVVIGEITYGDWKAVGGDSTFDAVKSPVVKGYILKDPAQKVVEKETVKSDAKDGIITVTYTKVGSYVPKVPEGVTPPSPTPYDNDPEDPTKVVTPSPEKPQDPKDPNSPKVPVLPQVPGHTPAVPKDPTKPVSPENPLVPLTPVDPNHPEKGYNVPPVPTTPGQDTPIEYVKDGQQKAITSFVDPKGNVLETPITETGDSNTPLTKDGEIKATIAKLKLKGYDVETNTYPPKGTFDNDPKVDQYFKVTLTPRVKPVKPFDPTNPKDPNKPVPGQPIDPDTPVDPNNPNDPTIPRWTDELINKLETTKQVTRTINYVDEKGNEVEKSSTDKVTFTRVAKINVVTGEITYADWKAVGGDSTFDAVKSPVVKGYILKDPAQKVVEKETVKSDAKDEIITVTYTKVGSYVPKVPEGVTPPSTTPYDNDPEDPTKVVTPNPEKPQDPKDPNSPKVPVLPRVPGHTPVVPKGPTKPVSPENPLVPLTPVDPNHPEKGYNVPPVPTTPGQDTPIEYVKDGQQKAITSFVDSSGKEIEPPVTDTGDSNTPLTKDGEIKATIAKLKLKGYNVVSNSYPEKGTFDKDSNVDQYFKVTLTPRVKPVKPFDPTNPKDPNKPVPGQPIDPDTPVDPNNPNDPTIPRWTEDLINKLETTKQIMRTINYVDEKGNELSKPSTDKVKFTREAKINVVTGEVTYADWKAVDGDDTFDKVPSPVVKGYILKDASQKVVEKETVKSDAKDETITVTYTKVGSYVPKVPEGVTPPSPTPYDNDPEDPTKVITPNPEKPQDSKDPNSPKVPVLPRVPGHTPVVPKDPTKPVSPENPLVLLTPVDPNHPEKGYNVPPVPTTPGQDTPIEYVKDGQQKAVIKFVVVGEDGKETELVTSRITTTGITGQVIPTNTFNEELKKLTGDPVNNGDYELVENSLKDGATFDKEKDEEGKDPSQVFTVKLRQIYILPPTPRIVERSGGNTVEVEVPNKDADTLSITFTKRNSTEKETIVTKKGKDGTWKIEKAPKGVTINPTNGLVYIPSKQVQPKTWVDTQTKHKYKQSKIVSVMPNILDVPEFVGATEWIDVNGEILRPLEKGIHEKDKFASYVWLESILEGDKITHIYFKGTPSVDKPEYKITVWFDKDGNPIKPDKPGTHESGKIPGYRFITTTTKDGVTVHKFEKITPVAPNKPTPEKPRTHIPGSSTIPNAVPGKVTEKQQVKRLANTGATETNTGLAGLGLAMFGMALAAIKRRKQK